MSPSRPSAAERSLIYAALFAAPALRPPPACPRCERPRSGCRCAERAQKLA